MFQYPPLTSPTSFRVLILHPGTGDKPLSGSLVLDDLDATKHQYEALSYYWGPPVFSQKIRIDSEYLDITQTLYDALTRMRLSDRDCVLWQKNHQVRLMSRIYTQCSRGIIYLGPEADNSELIPDFIHYLLEWLAKDLTSDNPASKPGAVMLNQVHNAIPPDDDARWVAFRVFLRRPWRRRLWVLQEFALPKDLIAICGHWEVDGTLVSTFILLFFHVMQVASVTTRDMDEAACREVSIAITVVGKHLPIRLALGHKWDLFGPGAIKQMFKEKPFPHHHLRMINLLHRAERSEVTDPRDRFFGLLGLAVDLDNDPSLYPDYNRSMNQISRAYHALFIRQGYGCQLLPRVQITKPMDLSRPWWMNSGLADDESEARILLSADLSLPTLSPEAGRAMTAVTQISDGDLFVRGFKVDQLRSRTSKCSTVDVAVFDEACRLQPTSNHCSIPSFRRMLVKILTLNRTHLGTSPVPEHFLDLYEWYIESALGGWKAFQQRLPRIIYDDDLDFSQAVGYALHALIRGRGACFGVTNAGYYGMFPPIAREGDQIFMIDGTGKTFLVRHQPDTDTYIWLGQIYVHNFEAKVQQCLKPENLTTIVFR